MQELIAGPWGPILIFVLRATDVAIATVRILLMHRGSRWVPVIGFFEMLLWTAAVGATVANLSSPWHVFAFAAGFAVGNWGGVKLEQRLAVGLAQIRVILREGGDELADFLRAAGFGVTEIAGEGKDGPVRILDVITPRREAARCIELVDAEVPGAFVVMEEPTRVRAGWMGRGRRI